MPSFITIRPVQAADYAAVYAFQQEYLESKSYEALLRRGDHPGVLYFAAYQDQHLAGIIYGVPSRKSEHDYVLQGVAVNLDASLGLGRQGIGSRLLQTFEEAARQTGACYVSVGSADDLKIEQFYLKNGYHPIELVAKGADYDELERVPVHDYEAAKILQEQLRKHYAAHEVIFIFSKKLS